jgi:serine/threonine protein kinase
VIDHQKMEKTTMMAGTFGYMAPEMPHTGKATKESDVYSFGVLMLEVVCGRRALEMSAIEQGEGILVDMVWRAHEAGHLLEMADPRLEAFPLSYEEDLESCCEVEKQEVSPILVTNSGTDDVDPSTIHTLDCAMKDEKLIAKLLHLGLLCCNPVAEDRPSMRVVSQLLQSSEANMEMHLPPLPDCKPHGRHSRRGFSDVAMLWSSWSSSSGPNVQDIAPGSSQSTSTQPPSGVSSAVSSAI